MTKNKPSKRPWRIGNDPGGRLGIWSHGCQTTSPDVCDVAAVPDAQDEANAALIVAAVNSYDVLRLALEATDQLIREALPKFNWGASALDANAIELLNMVPRLVKTALEKSAMQHVSQHNPENRQQTTTGVQERS